MYEYISGSIKELTPAFAVIETGGVGYFINISLQTHAKINNKKECKIFLHQIIREDTNAFFGFADKTEREIFRLLISVSGIGANTARVILSSLSSAEIKKAVQTEDVASFQKIKGIGNKTAQRVIIDLKDKILKTEAGDDSQVILSGGINTEAVSALTMLGFPKNKAEKAVKKIQEKNSELSAEEIVKNALKIL